MSYLGVVTFEFDPAKSASNKIKHGLDFEEAQELWKGERLEAPSPVESAEPRFFVIGKIKSRHYTAIITYRGSAVRIISIRASRPKEIYLYENS